jgi:hypothetical protein
LNSVVTATTKTRSFAVGGGGGSGEIRTAADAAPHRKKIRTTVTNRIFQAFIFIPLRVSVL